MKMFDVGQNPLDTMALPPKRSKEKIYPQVEIHNHPALKKFPIGSKVNLRVNATIHGHHASDRGGEKGHRTELKIHHVGVEGGGHVAAGTGVKEGEAGKPARAVGGKVCPTCGYRGDASVCPRCGISMMSLGRHAKWTKGDRLPGRSKEKGEKGESKAVEKMEKKSQIEE